MIIFGGGGEIFIIQITGSIPKRFPRMEGMGKRYTLATSFSGRASYIPFEQHLVIQDSGSLR